MPPAVAEATAAYREVSDHIGQFIEDCCVVEPSAKVTSGALWQRYQQWTVENEEVPLSRQTLGERLEKRGFQRDRSGHGGTRTWVGVGVSGEQSTSSWPSNGDTVTQDDTVSENFLTSEGIGKFSESTSPHVTTSPPVLEKSAGNFTAN